MSPESSERGRIAGVDYGRQRIGIALVDLEVRIATPHETRQRGTTAADAVYFARLAKEERLIRFVVGLPVHTDGQESVLSLEARRFGQWLEESTGVPVVFFDERYTSSQAEQLLGAAGLTRDKKKARIDKLAAQIMLTAYLESTNRDEPPRALDA